MEKRKIVLSLSMVILALGIMAGCGAEKTVVMSEVEKEKNTPSIVFTPQNYPRVDGSTVTIPLSEAMAAKLMNLPLNEARQYILHNTTHDAYVNLINGEKDVIFVTGPSEEELQLAEEKGVVLEIVPIVSEGFVFLVNKENKVEGLTMEQIRDIYSGKITNWNEVGGDNMKIAAYQRPLNSGSQTGMLDLVMKDIKMMEAPAEKIVAEMGMLIDAVATYTNEPNAIGYSYYYYVKDMWGEKQTKILAVDGIYPDKNTIRNGEYPIKTAYYAVMRSEQPKDSDARKFVDWLLSTQGQALAEESGYVKVK